jgi:hypothetical protein
MMKAAHGSGLKETLAMYAWHGLWSLNQNILVDAVTGPNLDI